MIMFEFDGAEGKLSINPLWIVSFGPVDDQRTRFSVAKKIEDKTVVETVEHTVDVPYHEFKALFLNATNDGRETKLALG